MYDEDLNAGELTKIDVYVSENETIPASSQRIDIVLEVAEPTLFLDCEKFNSYQSHITIYSEKNQNVKLMKELFTFVTSRSTISFFNGSEKQMNLASRM